MTTLTAGVYQDDYVTPGPFGFTYNQGRYEDIAHNNGWYDKRGERLGQGSLDASDFKKLVEGLEEGEFFITTGEMDNMVYFRDDWKSIDHLDFIIKKSQFLVTKGHAYIHDCYRPKWDKDTRTLYGFTFKVLSTDDVRKLLT